MLLTITLFISNTLPIHYIFYLISW